MARRCRKCGARLVVLAGRGTCATCGAQVTLIDVVAAPSRWTRKGARRLILKDAARQAPITYSLSWQGAELLARDWMRKHGYRDAELTPPGADGGIDIVARKAIAQVKHHARPVGLADIQRTWGIATSEHKKALFFSLTGYTPKAADWARRHDVALYTYPPITKV